MSQGLLSFVLSRCLSVFVAVVSLSHFYCLWLLSALIFKLLSVFFLPVAGAFTCAFSR